MLCAAALAAGLIVPSLHAEKISLGTTSADFTTEVERQLAPGVTYKYLKAAGRNGTTSGYTSCGTHVYLVIADLTEPTVSVEYQTASGTTGGSTKSLVNYSKALSTDGHRVLAGANANFWITSEQPWKSQMSLQPHGTAIHDGATFVQNATGGYGSHIGGPAQTGMIAFTADGRMKINYYTPKLEFLNTRINHVLDIRDFNRTVTEGSAVVYTPAWGRTKAFKPVTLNSNNTWSILEGKCTEVYLSLAPGETAMKVGGNSTTKYIVKEVKTNAGTGTLGNYDLCIVGQDIAGAPYAAVLAGNYRVGDELILTNQFITNGQPWPLIKEATSGNCMTMVAGNVIGSKGGPVDQSSYNNKVYARTIYGTNDDGTKLYIAVCGHKSNNYYGLSTDQLTYILKHFGATYAAQVDCGGSSQLLVDGSQVNKSTDSGDVRTVHSGMFIVSSAPEQLQPVTMKITPAENTYFGGVNVGASAEKTYNIEATNLRDDIKITISGANADQFSVTPSSIVKANGKGSVKVTYAPKSKGTHTATLNITTTDYSTQSFTLGGEGVQNVGADVIYQDDAAVFGYSAPSSYTVNPEYIDRAIPQLAGKVIKRVIARGDVLYILGLQDSNATIVVFDHVKGEVLRTLGTTANISGNCGISDIAITADGWLVAMNWVNDQEFLKNGKVLQYVWAKDGNGIAQGDPLPANITYFSGNYNTGVTGGTMAWSGTRESGWWYYPGRSASGSTFRIVALEMKNSQLLGANAYNKPAGITVAAFGDAFGAKDGGLTMFASPYADDEYIVNGSNSAAMLFPRTGNNTVPTVKATLSANVIPTNAVHTGIFRFGGKIYITSPSFVNSTTNNGILLADITSGLGSAKAVGVAGANLSSYDNTNVATTGTGVVSYDENGNYLESRLALFAVRNGAVSKFMTPSTILPPGVETPEITTNLGDTDFGEVELGRNAARSFTIEGENLQGDIYLTLSGSSDFKIDNTTISAADGSGSVTVTYTPSTRTSASATLTLFTAGMPEAMEFKFSGKGGGEIRPASFAYGLKVTETESMCDYTFSLSEKSENVTLVLRSESGKEYSYPQGSMSAGTHTLTVPYFLLEPGAYTWEVQVDNKQEPIGGRYFFEGAPKADSRGGVVAIKDTENEAFGLVVRSDGYAQGFTIYEPTRQKRGTYLAGFGDWTPTNRGSLYRLAYRKSDGCVYANDYANKGAGVYVFNPLHPEYGTGNIFAPTGATKDSGGCWTYNGVTLGGGCSGLCFTGEGANTRLWTYQEDYPSGDNADNHYVVTHNIGTASHVTTAPTIPNVKLARYGKEAKLANDNVNFHPCSHGVFIAQNRGSGNNNETTPGFMLVDFEGDIIYNSASQADIIPACLGAVALNVEENVMAVGMGTLGINIYDVTWNGDVPTLAYRATIPESMSTKGAGDEVAQMDFDYAGNLYVYYARCTNTHNGLNMFVVPMDAHTTTTPAPASQHFAVPVIAEVKSLTHSAQINTEDKYYLVSGNTVLNNSLKPSELVNGKINAKSDPAELTIAEQPGGVFTISSTKGYLALSGNNLAWSSTATPFSITVNADGTATVKTGDTNIGEGFAAGAAGSIRICAEQPREIKEVNAIADATEPSTIYVIKGNMNVLHAEHSLTDGIFDVFFTDGITTAAAHLPVNAFTAGLTATSVITDPIVTVSTADDRNMYPFTAMAGTLRGFAPVSGSHSDTSSLTAIHSIPAGEGMSFVKLENVVVNSGNHTDGYTLSHAFDRATELTVHAAHRNISTMVDTDGEKAPVYNVEGFYRQGTFHISSIEHVAAGYAVPEISFSTSVMEENGAATVSDDDASYSDPMTLYSFDIDPLIADHVVVFYTKDGVDPQTHLADGVQPVADPAILSTVQYVDRLDSEANLSLATPAVPYTSDYFTHNQDWSTFDQYASGKVFYYLAAGSEAERQFLATPRSLLGQTSRMSIKAIAVVMPQNVDDNKTVHFANPVTMYGAAFTAPQTWETINGGITPAAVQRAVSEIVRTGHSEVLENPLQIPTGVEAVTADADGEAIYFNLQGINCGNDESVLLPGVYIRYTATGTTKVRIN